jgi:hypothetical protein
MKLILILAILALPFIPQHSNADEAYLGLKTYHFERNGRSCLNETHDLFAYSKNNIHAGTYVNTHCRRSWLVGFNGQFGKGFGYDVSAVTGYPSAMQLVDGLIIIPMLTYSKYWGAFGVKVIHVPTVLMGIGAAVRF